MTVRVRPLIAAFSIALLIPVAHAQIRSNPLDSMSRPETTLGKNTPNLRSTFLTGKVALEDGGALPQPAAIQMTCSGHVRTLGYTDTKGGFVLQLNGVNSGVIGANESDPDGYASGQDCEIRADLAGYLSSKVDLPHTPADLSNVNVGTLVMAPTNKAAGLMISATSAEAPKKARNAYEKGQNAIRKGDWQAAANNFGKAVREFPRYATAWQELGLVQLKLNQKDAAQESFHAAVEADPKLLPSYAELAEMALEQKRWQDVVDETDHLLQLDPVNYPQFWFLNSAANYNLQKIDQAERSVLRGLAIDKIQRFPKMQYLLGVILALKHDYRGAALHIRQYLSLVPHAPDAQIAERQLQQCEKLSGAGN